LSAGSIALVRQPRTLREAQAWARYLLQRGRSVSVGLMQVSTERLADLGLTANELFDPCTNVRAAAGLLATKYQHAAANEGGGQEALLRALSEYNSGSITLGFNNGYVRSILNGEFNPRH